MTHLRHLVFLFLVVLAAGSLLLTSCEPREDIVTTDPNATLTASVELVKFDTVFVSRGSITKRFWVYNRNPKAVRVDEISLVGAASPTAQFELIIDGRAGSARRDFELRGKDSVLVLAKVTIDPNQSDTAFVVMDSVRLRANGTTRYVRLRAFGENARYYDAPAGLNPVIQCGTTWDTRLPIVVLKTALVDSNCVLTIKPGTRVYMANGASLLVRGNLICGALGDGVPPVKFRGLRRDDYFDTSDPRYADATNFNPKYANTPGQWGTIAFEPRRGNQLLVENQLLNTDIRNSTIGVLIQNFDYLSGHHLRIESCLIRHAYSIGVYGVAAGVDGGSVKLINTVVTLCGERAVLGLGGGNWQLSHCTLAMGSGLFSRRETEALAFNNAVDLGNGVIGNAMTKLTVENSILWSGVFNDRGRLQNEILLLREGTNQDSSYTFRHNVLQTPFSRFNTNPAYAGSGAIGTNVLNQDPLLRNELPYKLDLRLDSLNQSPAYQLGELLTPAVPFDLRGRTRDGSRPDAGAYEHEQP
jgi:hypothetical protein